MSVTAPRVGVLALQGDFACHEAALAALGVTAVRATLPKDLNSIDALVMPGGESTTMLRLIEAMGIRGALERCVATKPVLATCAGLILLAREADGLPAPTLGVLDVRVVRNGYGRQIDSFTGALRVPAVGEDVSGVFIRAPRILGVGPAAEAVAWYGDEVVGVRQGRILGLCFHPELTRDRRLHRWFLTAIAGLAMPPAAEPKPRRHARTAATPSASKAAS